MKTVFQINVVANWGSTGRIAEEIGRLAMSEGWRSFIAYGRYANKSLSELIKIGNKFDQSLHLAGTRFFDLHGRLSQKATKHLVSQIEQVGPDIIHLHNVHGYFLNYPILFSYFKQSGIPIVWTLHDCWTFTGHCAHFEYNNCVKWRNEGCRICRNKSSYPTSWLISDSARNYELKHKYFSTLPNLHLVAVSQWLADYLRESFFSTCDICVINNGIDLDVFNPKEVTKEVLARYSIESNKRIVLGVASVWTKQKGLPDFLKLRQLLDCDRYAIVLVGLTDKQMANLPDGIIGVKRTNNVSELAELYSAADVYVNPTLEDTFPTTNIEALACGTPVVTYRTGGSPEIIDNITGIVVNKSDIVGMKNGISTIVESKDNAYTKNDCRMRAEALYNKQERFQDYLKLYNSLV